MVTVNQVPNKGVFYYKAEGVYYLLGESLEITDPDKIEELYEPHSWILTVAVEKKVCLPCQALLQRLADEVHRNVISRVGEKEIVMVGVDSVTEITPAQF